MGPEAYQPPCGHGVMEGGGCQCTERSCCWAGGLVFDGKMLWIFSIPRCCDFSPEKSNFYTLTPLEKRILYNSEMLLENERQWQLIENTKKVQKGLS